MTRVAAPKKELTAATRARLEQARARSEEASSALWAACSDALSEGTYDEIAAVVGVARSTLQEKVRQQRAG